MSFFITSLLFVFFIELSDFIHEQFFQETSIFFCGTIRGSNNTKNLAANDKAVTF